MSRSESRNEALQLVLTTAAILVGAFLWISLLSFHPADPPSSSVWPANSPPRNWCGPIGAWIAYYLYNFAGLAALLAALLFTGALAAASRRRPLPDLWLRLMGGGLAVGAASTLLTMYVQPSAHFLVSGPGGLIGLATSNVLVTHLQRTGATITLASAVLVGLLLSADQVVLSIGRWFGNLGRSSAPVLVRAGGAALAGAGAAVSAGVSTLRTRIAAEREPDVAPAALAPRSAARAARAALPAAPADRADELAPPTAAETRSPRPVARAALALEAEHEQEPGEPRNSPASRGAAEPRDREMPLGRIKVTDVEQRAERPAPTPAAPLRSRVGNYELPSLQLLEEPEPVDREAIEALCREKAYVLEQTLNEFRLEVQVVAIETGPVITVFELKLAPGIKVSQIMSLTNDMARALRAPAVRVVAPMPGKNTIGIEVPNLDKERVRVKELIRTAPAKAQNYAIPLYLGKDASGAPLIADLTTMPHLLIAGTTGSGKSVCVSSIIMSILLSRTPDEVNLILVDPKVVELAMFKDVPHLICPIVTEMTKAEGILDWAATKMDERYELLAEAGVKEIRAYNKLGEAGLRERMQIASDEEMQRIPVHLPYIVIVVDELADLMMTSAKEVEFYLCRLAQKSRAVGIHLIVSTQRPQANVVTGLIKSNLPSRIAFRVSSRLDSRIVLDQNGGEVLMGQGDMLFLPPGSSKLVRAQGSYISDDELRAVVKHARAQGQPSYHPELIRMPKPGDDAGAERDELFDEAVDAMIESGRGSVSLLQRRLNIGYGRASRLIDQMYAAGIVGDYKGSQAREVVISQEEWEQMKLQRDREEAAEQGELFS